MTSDEPIYNVTRDGEITISARIGDDTVTIQIGDGMDAAAHLVRLYLETTTNTKMGTSEHRQKAQLRRIRKAMGYTW
jgi:hypothetical protein